MLLLYVVCLWIISGTSMLLWQNQYNIDVIERYIMLWLLCRRGSLLSTAIFMYAATAPVNGYFGGSLYARMGGQ